LVAFLALLGILLPLFGGHRQYICHKELSEGCADPRPPVSATGGSIEEQEHNPLYTRGEEARPEKQQEKQQQEEKGQR